MKDILEQLEMAAEDAYFQALQDDGGFKCVCGTIFNPEKEGGLISPNPYAMPVCPKCYQEALLD